VLVPENVPTPAPTLIEAALNVSALAPPAFAEVTLSAPPAVVSDELSVIVPAAAVTVVESAPPVEAMARPSVTLPGPAMVSVLAAALE
jgi:hypothetical protein